MGSEAAMELNQMRFGIVLGSALLVISSTSYAAPSDAPPAVTMSTSQAQTVAIELFEKICVQTEDHQSAKVQARNGGFFYAPPALGALLSEMHMEDGVVLMKAFDGAFALAMTGVAPNARPEFADQVCAVGISPSDSTMPSAVKNLIGVGDPQPQSDMPVIWYKVEGKKRLRIEQSTLRGADIRKGLRPRAVIVQTIATPYGPTALIMQLETRPR